MSRFNAEHFGLVEGDKVTFGPGNRGSETYVPGTVVTLVRDDGSSWPYFEDDRGTTYLLYLTDKADNQLFTIVDANGQAPAPVISLAVLTALSGSTIAELSDMLDTINAEQAELDAQQASLLVRKEEVRGVLTHLLNKLSGGAQAVPAAEKEVSIGQMIEDGTFEIHNCEGKRVRFVKRVCGFNGGEEAHILDIDAGDSYPLRVQNSNNSDWLSVDDLQSVYFIK